MMTASSSTPLFLRIFLNPADDGDTVTDYWCDGHEVSVCHGHKDIDIFIKVGTMEDYFFGRAGALDATGKAYEAAYEAFISRGGWTDTAKDWAKTLYGMDWVSLYGTNAEGMFQIGTTQTISEEEVGVLLSNLEINEDISEERKQIVAYAMSQVGRISYYWGGKAAGPDEPLMTHYGAAGSIIGADYKGRNVAGLDCYGFVQYTYWHVLGMHIPTSTTKQWIANAGYGSKQVSSENLQPGDMGVYYHGKGGHTGIFAGYQNGNAVWIHCSGAPSNTVVMNAYDGFDHYYNVLGN